MNIDCFPNQSIIRELLFKENKNPRFGIRCGDDGDEDFFLLMLVMAS